jgi:hypothetical protein
MPGHARAGAPNAILSGRCWVAKKPKNGRGSCRRARASVRARGLQSQVPNGTQRQGAFESSMPLDGIYVIASAATGQIDWQVADCLREAQLRFEDAQPVNLELPGALTDIDGAAPSAVRHRSGNQQKHVEVHYFNQFSCSNASWILTARYATACSIFGCTRRTFNINSGTLAPRDSGPRILALAVKGPTASTTSGLIKATPARTAHHSQRRWLCV